MGAKLDKLIRECAVARVENLGSSGHYSDEAREEVITALSNQWRDEIKAEVIDELTEAEKKKIDKKLQEHKTKKDIENLRTLVRESIFLAIIVGVLVNQITDIITHFKAGDHTIAWTWGFIVLLGIGVWSYVLFRLATVISTLLGNKESVDESNS